MPKRSPPTKAQAPSKAKAKPHSTPKPTTKARPPAKAPDRRQAKSPAISTNRPTTADVPQSNRSGLHIPDPVQLKATIVDSWRATILENIRLPKGTKGQGLSAPARLQLAIRQETAQVSDLWTIFNQDRSALTRKLLWGKPEAMAYLIGFHLANVARTQLALTRSEARTGILAALTGPKGAGEVAPKRRVVWHDLGAGTGAGAQAGLAWLQEAGVADADLELHLHDGSGALLDLARSVFTAFAPGVSVRTHRVDLERLSLAPTASREATGTVLVESLGYVWNELARNPVARNRLLSHWRALAGEQGREALLVVTEPATEAQSRAALTLRDELVEAGWRPLYPCPSAPGPAGPCPMASGGRDWCFSEGSWRQPPEALALDRRLGMDRSRLTSTLLVLASPTLAARLPRAATGPTLPRAVVVGRPVLADTGFQHLVCTAAGLAKMPPVTTKTATSRAFARGLTYPRSQKTP